MNVIRWLGRGLLLTIITASISLWVATMTLQNTLLNREVVKGWLANSGAYDHVLDSVLNLQNIGQDSQGLDQAALKKALADTLTPSFIKTVTEKGLDGTYDWLEGKADKISFSIPVGDKRDQLQKELQAAIEPQLKNLPACTGGFTGLSSQEIKCLPPGSDVHEAAASAAKQAVEGSDFLTKPITEESLDQSGLQNIAWLPILVQDLGPMSIGLPIIAAICGLVYVFIGDKKLRSLRTLSGHVLFGSALGTVAGGLIWYFGGKVQLESSEASGPVDILQYVVQPIIYQAAPSIGFWLTVFAGSIALVSGITWLILLILGKRAEHSKLLEPVDEEQGQNVVESAPKPEDTSTSPTPSKPEHTVAPVEPKPPVRPTTIGRM